jgi:hypothetical protein
MYDRLADDKAAKQGNYHWRRE